MRMLTERWEFRFLSLTPPTLARSSAATTLSPILYYEQGNTPRKLLEDGAAPAYHEKKMDLGNTEDTEDEHWEIIAYLYLRSLRCGLPADCYEATRGKVVES